MTTTGADQIVVFDFESEFAQDPTSNAISSPSWKVFGTDESFDSQDRDQGSERIFRPFSRQTDEVLEGAFEGSWSQDFTLTNGHWLRFIYGDPTNSTSPYSFSLSSTNPPRTAHIVEETHYDNGDIEQTVYTGCAASSASVDVSVEDPVSISLDGSYATEYTRSTGRSEDLIYGTATGGVEENLSGQPDTQYRPVHFGNSELKLDIDNSGTADFVGLVQDATVDLEGNAEMENELGTRFAAAVSFLQFEVDLSFTKIVNSDSQDELKRRMYGAEAAGSGDSPTDTPLDSLANSDMTGELFMDAGLSSETNTYTFSMSGTWPDSYSRNNVGSPEDVVEEDIDRLATDVTVEVASGTVDLTV